MVADVGDDGEIVLHHQHRAGLRHLADDVGNGADILLPHASHRLVQQQHLGIKRQRRGNLKHPLAAIGEIRSQRIAFTLQADRLDQFVGAGIQAVERGDRQPELCRKPVWPLQRDAYIVEHRQMRKNRRNLEGADQPHPRDPVRRRLGDVRAQKRDRTRRRLQEFGEQVEDGRLAGAVRADQRMDARVADVEIHVLHRHEGAEALRETAGGQHHPRLFLFCCRGDRHYFTRSQPLLAGSM